jgi:hypothetical protein
MDTNQWSNTTTTPIFTRDAPCSCGDCADCDTWLSKEGDATYPLIASDNGKCYQRTKNNIAITLPVVGTIRAGAFCVTFRNTALPAGDFYVRPAPEDATVHFYEIGVVSVPYDYITVNHGGEVCICFDGTNFSFVGGATGWQDGPG